MDRGKTLRWLKSRKIAVLYGGWSDESTISRKTGAAVLNALRQLGVKAEGIDVDRSIASRLSAGKFGFCFVALHGKFGEDGTVQGLLEMMNIPYSGSGVLASALSMNKAACKDIFKNRGIPTAPFQLIGADEAGKARIGLPLPFVVKPVDGGSAIGVTIVRKSSDAARAVRTALRHSSHALAEKFIEGREVTAAVLGDRVLPLIEIVPKSPFYDFKAKYVKGMSDHILPARVSERAAKEIRRHALAAHRALGCRACSRIDFIVDRKDRPWVLEVNSIPGMTETSLFPEAARAVGLSFPETILEIVRLSLEG